MQLRTLIAVSAATAVAQGQTVGVPPTVGGALADIILTNGCLTGPVPALPAGSPLSQVSFVIDGWKNQYTEWRIQDVNAFCLNNFNTVAASAGCVSDL
jgi:hypothetical protein